jgi:hypothetical protein
LGFFGGEERADTRGGLSKGLGAFRIGRPLGSDNRFSQKAFPRDPKFLQAGGCGKLFTMTGRGLGDFGGMAVGGTEQHDQQQQPGDQGFDGMFENEGRNTHGSLPFKFVQIGKSFQIGGLPRNAPEKALTIKRTTKTISNNLAMDAAKPARAKKPI